MVVGEDEKMRPQAGGIISIEVTSKTPKTLIAKPTKTAINKTNISCKRKGLIPSDLAISGQIASKHKDCQFL